MNPPFQTPQTPIGQFQTAFRPPHLNATFPSTFQIHKHQKHLKKVRAPTRTAVVVVVVATTSREVKKEEFIENTHPLICMDC